MFFFVLAFSYCSLLQQATLTLAHTRLECPPPFSAETGNKQGPCDVMSDDDSDATDDLPAFPLVANALNTITWLESISHPGAPARFALSLDGQMDGFKSCILLDHVPHDEYSFPNTGDPTSYHRSSITLWIPDIQCERCYLQLITVMTDEIHGLPPGETCVYPFAKELGNSTANANANDNTNTDVPTCQAVYHSCAPVRINGTLPRNNMAECPTAEFEQELEWPFQTNQQYSTYYYKGNPGKYDPNTAQLEAGGSPIVGCNNFLFCDPEQYFTTTVDVPDNAKYRQLEGTCASVVNMQVEDFVLGQIPSTPKEAQLQGNPDTSEGNDNDNSDNANPSGNNDNHSDINNANPSEAISSEDTQVDASAVHRRMMSIIHFPVIIACILSSSVSFL